jgi:epoxyqueuosine reductase
LIARDDLASPPLAELAALDEAGFRTRFAGGPVKRIGHARFLRNVMIAIGNSGDPRLREAARHALGSPSALVRGAAAWALGRLCTPEEGRALARSHGVEEHDPTVAEEWRAAFPGHEWTRGAFLRGA